MKQETQSKQPAEHLPQSSMSKRIQLAILDMQKLSKLPQMEADKIVNNIWCMEKSCKKNNHQSNKQSNRMFFHFSESEMNQCFSYIKEWRIQCLEYFHFVDFFGLGAQPKSSFYNIFHIKFTNLRKLSMKNKSIRQLPAMQYPQSFNLQQSLQFTNCQFGNMATLLLFPLHQLKRLSLNQNSIKSVKFLQNIDFLKLEILSLANNNLQQSSELDSQSLPALQILDLRSNKLDSLKFISVNKFLQLKFLNLCYNQITSIENLAQANLPHLQMLNLKNNKISSIRPLQRLSLPNIREISMVGNLILEFCSVTELHCEHGASVFLFQTSDNYRAIAALAKIPQHIALNFKDIKSTTMKQDKFLDLFGKFYKTSNSSLDSTYQVLSKRNFLPIELKPLNDISYY